MLVNLNWNSESSGGSERQQGPRLVSVNLPARSGARCSAVVLAPWEGSRDSRPLVVWPLHRRG